MIKQLWFGLRVTFGFGISNPNWLDMHVWARLDWARARYPRMTLRDARLLGLLTEQDIHTIIHN